MATTRVPRRPSALPKRLKPRKSPSQQRSQALVDAIVEAGSRVLASRGWNGLSLQQVATVAGVSPGSLYQYFPDKAALVAEITERLSQRELSFTIERFSSLELDASLEASVSRVVSTLIEFQRREGPLMRAALDALQHLGRYEQLADRARQAAQFLRGLLEQHRARLVPQDLELATHVVANAVHSLTHDGVLPRPATLDDATLQRELERLVLGYLLPRSNGAPAGSTAID
jgi:AcrR family transcriptional regulator